MKTVIDDPETTEQLLKDAGFEVAVRDMAFEVSLRNRSVQSLEVAEVLGCEPDELGRTPRGVLVT